MYKLMHVHLNCGKDILHLYISMLVEPTPQSRKLAGSKNAPCHSCLFHQYPRGNHFADSNPLGEV